MRFNILYWLANHNFFGRPTIIRKWQCDIFGHCWFTYLRDSGWCAWCGRVAGKYPKMRVRKPENEESRITFLQQRKAKTDASAIA